MKSTNWLHGKYGALGIILAIIAVSDHSKNHFLVL